MPAFQAMCERANQIFSRQGITSFKWPEGASFTELARAAKIVRTEAEIKYLDQWPVTLLNALTAIYKTAYDSDPRVPVQIVWHPAYDYNVSAWDAHSTADSIRAITVVISGPYPS